MSNTHLSRRKFLHTTGLGAGAVLGFPAIVSGQNLNDRIRVAAIGVGGKGESDINNVAKCGCDIVGLCDVDAKTLGRMSKKYPKAKTFSDFREMLPKMDAEIDAVIVSAPDHIHGVAAIPAMQAGKHVYVQKPLAQTVWECRVMGDLAREKKLATQMGNQGSAAEGLRRSVEVIQTGVLGKPLELHVWTNRPIWPQGFERPSGSDPVPEHLDWDLWLGPAAERPYKNGIYHPFKWRGWTDFGTGALGDMACHTVNMPFRALKLGYPEKIECEMASKLFSETYPMTSRVRFDFPAREDLPPLKFWWYDGNPGDPFKPIMPYPELLKDIIALRGKTPKSGALIVFENGMLYSEDDYGRAFWVKTNDDKEFVSGTDHPLTRDAPQVIPRSPGHEQEWIDMMRDGTPAYSNFEIAAYLTEVILLGSIAQRVGEGLPIAWDGPNMKAKGNDAASALVKRPYRDGWAPQV
ncbi:NADH-dependent dehydrogenase [Haloferula helveola]|uniref:NADH-dependent dehydrogenase n=1 Tax=Haloferula helveola TaxID=490095 RepID=A0ABN6H0E0_9BACT|nr:NADH-dependent dehydrogenase [Haloferula helveola]